MNISEHVSICSLRNVLPSSLFLFWPEGSPIPLKPQANSEHSTLVTILSHRPSLVPHINDAIILLRNSKYKQQMIVWKTNIFLKEIVQIFVKIPRENMVNP